jgi:hypothetical protein
MIGQELKGVKALLVTPTYGPVDPDAQKSLRVAMMTAANHGLNWAGDASPDRMTYGYARNKAAQVLFDFPDLADGIMWVDSDIMVDPMAITRLVETAVSNKVDFATGIYHKRAGNYEPLIYHFDPIKEKFFIIPEYPENTFMKVGGCGFGFVWTGVNCLTQMSKHPTFDSKRGWFPDMRDMGGFGEDLNFCYKAIQCGVQLYADTGVQVGHLGDAVAYGREHYLQAYEKIKDKALVQDPPEVWGTPAVSLGI